MIKNAVDRVLAKLSKSRQPLLLSTLALFLTGDRMSGDVHTRDVLEMAPKDKNGQDTNSTKEDVRHHVKVKDTAISCCSFLPVALLTYSSQCAVASSTLTFSSDMSARTPNSGSIGCLDAAFLTTHFLHTIRVTSVRPQDLVRYNEQVYDVIKKELISRLENFHLRNSEASETLHPGVRAHHIFPDKSQPILIAIDVTDLMLNATATSAMLPLLVHGGNGTGSGKDKGYTWASHASRVAEAITAYVLSTETIAARGRALSYALSSSERFCPLISVVIVIQEGSPVATLIAEFIPRSAKGTCFRVFSAGALSTHSKELDSSGIKALLAASQVGGKLSPWELFPLEVSSFLYEMLAIIPVMFDSKGVALLLKSWHASLRIVDVAETFINCVSAFDNIKYGFQKQEALKELEGLQRTVEEHIRIEKRGKKRMRQLKMGEEDNGEDDIDRVGSRRKSQLWKGNTVYRSTRNEQILGNITLINIMFRHAALVRERYLRANRDAIEAKRSAKGLSDGEVYRDGDDGYDLAVTSFMVIYFTIATRNWVNLRKMQLLAGRVGEDGGAYNNPTTTGDPYYYINGSCLAQHLQTLLEQQEQGYLVHSGDASCVSSATTHMLPYPVSLTPTTLSDPDSIKCYYLDVSHLTLPYDAIQKKIEMEGEELKEVNEMAHNDEDFSYGDKSLLKLLSSIHFRSPWFEPLVSPQVSQSRFLSKQLLDSIPFMVQRDVCRPISTSDNIQKMQASPHGNHITLFPLSEGGAGGSGDTKALLLSKSLSTDFGTQSGPTSAKELSLSGGFFNPLVISDAARVLYILCSHELQLEMRKVGGANRRSVPWVPMSMLWSIACFEDNMRLLRALHQLMATKAIVVNLSTMMVCSKCLS